MGLGPEDLPYLSLFISGLALGVAVVSLGWQILSFLLAGSRVRVRMYLGRREDMGMLVSASVNKWPAPEGEPITSRTGRFTTEVVVVDVHNGGRTAVTVDPPSLSTGYQRASNAKSVEDDVPEGPRRIEAGDRARWTLDLWPLVRSFRREQDGGKLRLRAEVEVGGRRRPKRSSWWRPLVVPPDAESLTYASPPSDEWVVYNALVERLPDKAIGLGFAAMETVRLVDEGADQEQVTERLQELTGQVAVHFAAYEALNRLGRRREARRGRSRRDTAGNGET